MENFFWIQDSAYNNVGGKNHQFGTLHQVFQYIEKRGFIAQGLGNVYEVHEAISKGGVPIEDVVEAFRSGESPASLEEIE